MNHYIRGKWVISALSLILLTVLIGCSTANEKAGNEGKVASTTAEPVEGGTLKVAFRSDPDTLDWMLSGASSTRDVAWHIFETLFALDKDFEVKPMIAKDYTVSEDGKVYTIPIREGVKFHDGSTVKAEDVAASIKRWEKVSTVGKVSSAYITNVEAVDEYTVKVTLSEPYTALINNMASPKTALTIIPAEIAAEAGEQPLKPDQLVGTGPYQFTKWDRGQEIVLSRFEGYVPREEKNWGGLAGKKMAYFDKIKFQIVQSPQVMLNGLKTGIYDYAQSIPSDLYQVVKSLPKIDPVTYMNGYNTLIPDKSEAPFDDLQLRKALNQAINKKTIGKAVYGNKDFYGLDGALFFPEQKALYSKNGTEGYLAYNPENAEKLVKQSEYQGEPIEIVYASNYPDYEQTLEVVKQQLEAVGFKVKLLSYEWATYLEKTADSANYDLNFVGWSNRFSPAQLGMLQTGDRSSGWYESERWESLLYQWGKTTNAADKKSLLVEMNQTLYDELPFIKMVNKTQLDIKSGHVKSYSNWVGPRFWNTWMVKNK